jgi:hypothetical protein
MQPSAQTSQQPEPESRMKLILKTYFPFLLLPELPDSPGQALTKRIPVQENSR